jgi:hypothetical protein
MPTLSQPPSGSDFDQTRVPDRDHYEFCGETSLAAALTALGHVVSPAAVGAWLRTRYGEGGVGGGTDGPELAAFASTMGVSLVTRRGAAGDYVRAAVDAGHYSLCACWCDHQANPIPYAQSVQLHSGGIGHWMLAYGYQPDGSIDVLQPWGGRIMTYNLSSGQDQGYGMEILATALTPEDAPMSPDERLDIGRALTKLTYIAAAHRVEEDQSTEDFWAARMRDGSFVLTMDAMLTSGEFVNNMNKDRLRNAS